MTDHFCVECEAGYVGERCPSCGSTPLVFTSRDADAIESDRDLYKQQRDELLAAVEEHRTQQNGAPRGNVTAADRSLYRAAERVRKGQ